MVIYKASLKLQGFWQRVKESKSYLTNFSCIHEKTKPHSIKEDFATASVKLPRGHKGTHVRGTQSYLCSSKQNIHQYYHHIGYKLSMGYFTNICIPALLLLSSLLIREAGKQVINSCFFTPDQETNCTKSPCWVT